MEYGKKGWFFSIGKQSDWGDVTTFYDQIKSCVVHEDNSSMTIEAEIWGTIDHTSGYPEKGDGIAFYHSSSAFFSGADYWDRKRRVQMIGVIDEIEYEDRQLKFIRFTIDVRGHNYSPGKM